MIDLLLVILCVIFCSNAGQIIEWNSGTTTTAFKEMTSKLKSWSGNSSSLWFAMKVEKDLQKSATNFATTKSNGMTETL